MRQETTEGLRERAEEWPKDSQSKAAETASGVWSQASHRSQAAHWHDITNVTNEADQRMAHRQSVQNGDTASALESIKSLTQHHKDAKEAHSRMFLYLQRHYRAPDQ